MKKTTNKLIIENICLLFPFILYGIYKNGFLLYQKNLISVLEILKPLYLVLISVAIKIIVDLIKDKKINFDYNFVYVILIGMMMPCNINLILYTITFFVFYILFHFLEKYIKINKVCLIGLIIIFCNFLLNDFTYMSLLEKNYEFNFSFTDYLFGRNIGSISTSSIILSIISYIYLLGNFYYKKDIPFMINITYVILAFIYLFIYNDGTYLLNSELIFGSIFVATLSEYSPYSNKFQILYGIFIGIIAFIVSLLFDKILAIYIAIFITSTIMLILSLIKTKK